MSIVKYLDPNIYHLVCGAGKGYPKKKFGWNKLKHVDEISNQIRLRTKSVEAKYLAYLRYTKSNYGSVDNFILENMKSFKANLLITKNNYPYNVADSILHLVLWVNPYGTKHGKLCEGEVFNFLIKKFGLKRSASDDEVNNTYILFENSSANKSVRSIEHYQLFVKKDLAKKVDLKLARFEFKK